MRLYILYKMNRMPKRLKKINYEINLNCVYTMYYIFECYRMILPDGTFLGSASDLPDDVVNVAETMEERVHLILAGIKSK